MLRGLILLVFLLFLLMLIASCLDQRAARGADGPCTRPVPMSPSTSSAVRGGV